MRRNLIKKAIILTLCVFFSLSFSREKGGASPGYNWKLSLRGIPQNAQFTCISSDDAGKSLYLGATDGVYSSGDMGLTWGKERLPSARVNITKIAASAGAVFASSKSGLYGKFPGGKWKFFPGVKNLLGVMLLENALAVVWSKDKVFLLFQSQWRDITPQGSYGIVSDLTAQGDVIYLALGGSLFYSNDLGESWEKCFILRNFDEDIVFGDEIDYPYEEEVSPPIRDLDLLGEKKVLLTTGKGLYVFTQGKDTPEVISTKGLPSGRVEECAVLGRRVVVATANKVFNLTNNNNSWETVFENPRPGKIIDLLFTNSSEEDFTLFILTERNIYKVKIKPTKESSLNSTIKALQGEPTIREVQEMAIEYAEVSPEKIRRWRRAASVRAILPRLSVDYNESFDDNIEIYKNSTTSYAVRGPRERGNDWGVDLTWDLSELIWSDAQTAIDVRSKLMVQLRDDILEDVTRLYFERKRLILELEKRKNELEMKKISEKSIRIEELTGYIDALTGGRFSDSLENEPPN